MNGACSVFFPAIVSCPPPPPIHVSKYVLVFPGHRDGANSHSFKVGRLVRTYVPLAPKGGFSAVHNSTSPSVTNQRAPLEGKVQGQHPKARRSLAAELSSCDASHGTCLPASSPSSSASASPSSSMSSSPTLSQSTQAPQSNCSSSSNSESRSHTRARVRPRSANQDSAEPTNENPRKKRKVVRRRVSQKKKVADEKEEKEEKSDEREVEEKEEKEDHLVNIEVKPDVDFEFTAGFDFDDMLLSGDTDVDSKSFIEGVIKSEPGRSSFKSCYTENYHLCIFLHVKRVCLSTPYKECHAIDHVDTVLAAA